MKILKYIIVFTFTIFLLSSPCFSQKTKINNEDYQNFEVEMADRLRADGKIYVVVAVMTTILLGLIVYLIAIDRKISKLEKEFNLNKK